MIDSITFTLLVVTLIGYLVYRRGTTPKHHGKELPGPTPIPFFGNSLQMGKHMHISFDNWAKKYGPIFSIKMFKMRMVHITDYKLVKEIFASKDYAGRMAYGYIHDLFDGGLRPHGIINTEGREWEELRRFTLRHLRDLGFGKKDMETYIMEDLNEHIEWIKSKKGQPIGNLKEKFNLVVVSAIWTIIAGKRCQHDDPELLKLIENMTLLLRESLGTGMILLFGAPWVKDYFPEWSGFNKWRRIIGIQREYFSKTVEEHKKTYSDDHTRDFTDEFLKEIKNTKDTTSPFYGELGERMLVAVINDLFGAGADSTSATLAWTMLYLTKYPEVQKKLQDEIESVTKGSRSVSLTDKASLPYTEALTSEILRFSSVVAPGIPHRATVASIFHGFAIPKNSTILSNLHYIHKDPKNWGDPENFRPERFLDTSTNPPTVIKNEALMPFSTGRRQCPGEPLARDTLFLFITNIFQTFNVKLVGDAIFEPEVGISLYPKPFECSFEERK